jgi:hypothetical protein
MRLKLLFTLLALTFAACIPTPAPTDSGIYGQVTIGPTCPVVQINNPCSDKPYQATLTVLTASDHQKVTQVQTDANGNYRVALAPGEYILHPESPAVMPRAADIPFVVRPQEFTDINVGYDSGIR